MFKKDHKSYCYLICTKYFLLTSFACVIISLYLLTIFDYVDLVFSKQKHILKGQFEAGKLAWYNPTCFMYNSKLGVAK